MTMMILSLILLAVLNLPPEDILGRASEQLARDNYEQAMETVNGVLPQLRSSGDTENLAEALSLLSAIYYRMGAFNLALKAQTECYHIDLQGGDPAQLSSSLHNLAGICISVDDDEGAYKYIMQAIEYEEPLGDDKTLAIRYGMASDVLLKCGKPEEALEYSTKALALDTEGGRLTQAAIRKSQMADCLIVLGRLDEAKPILLEAYWQFHKDSLLNSISITAKQLGHVALKEGRRNEAVNYYREALDISTRVGNKNHIKNLCLALSDALVDSSPAESVQYMKKAMALKDSIFVSDLAREVGALRLEYDMREKDLKLAEQQSELRARYTIIVLLTFLLIALGAGLFLLYRYAASQRRNVDMLRKAAELKDRMLAVASTVVSKQENEELKSISRSLASLGQEPASLLTKREREVASYCCDGLSSKQIAAEMNLSQRTIESHKNNIFRKLGISTTVELVMLMSESSRRSEDNRPHDNGDGDDSRQTR